jgi:hypothetical protein
VHVGDGGFGLGDLLVDELVFLVDGHDFLRFLRASWQCAVPHRVLPCIC